MTNQVSCLEFKNSGQATAFGSFLQTQQLLAATWLLILPNHRFAQVATKGNDFGNCGVTRLFASEKIGEEGKGKKCCCQSN